MGCGSSTAASSADKAPAQNGKALESQQNALAAGSSAFQPEHISAPTVPSTGHGKKWSGEGGVSASAAALHARSAAVAAAGGAAAYWAAAYKADKIERTSLRGAGVWIAAVALSADGRFVAAASELHAVTVWSVATGNSVATLSGHSAPVTCLAFRGDTLATGSEDRTVRLWAAPRNWACSATLDPGFKAAVSCVAWSADGAALAAGSLDGWAAVWDAASRQQRCALPHYDSELESLLHPVYCAAFLPNSQSKQGAALVTGAWDGAVRVWDVATGEPKRALRGHSQLVRCLAASGDGATIASAAGRAGRASARRSATECRKRARCLAAVQRRHGSFCNQRREQRTPALLAEPCACIACNTLLRSPFTPADNHPYATAQVFWRLKQLTWLHPRDSYAMPRHQCRSCPSRRPGGAPVGCSQRRVPIQAVQPQR